MRRMFLTLGVTLAAAACSSTTPQEPPTLSLEHFTTVGKATKTVQTPNGPAQVYDPTQDAEVIAAFEYVHSLGPDNASSYRKMFDNIRQIQIADLTRLGCAGASLNGCSGLGINSQAAYVCQGNLSMGAADLNACEAGNTEAPIPGAFIGSCKFGPKDKAYQGDLSYNLIGQKTVPGASSAMEEIKYYFNAQCHYFKDAAGQKVVVEE